MLLELIYPRIDCARNTVRYNSSADAVKRVIELDRPLPNQRDHHHVFAQEAIEEEAFQSVVT